MKVVVLSDNRKGIPESETEHAVDFSRYIFLLYIGETYLMAYLQK